MAQWRWFEHMLDQQQVNRLRLLENVPIFAGLTRRQLGKILVKLYEKTYAAGETIFNEGDPGKALFIVLQGQVAITRLAGPGEEVLATLAEGAYFGELALIDDQPRFATARAEKPSILLVLYKSEFDQLIEGHSRIAVRVMNNLLKTLVAYLRRAEAHPGSESAIPRVRRAEKTTNIGTGKLARD